MKIDEVIGTPPVSAMERARATKNPLRKLYFWTLHWADTKHSLWALIIISFTESSFFPVPPDVLLLPMCMARPKKWLTYAFWCTAASVAGAVLGWGIGLYIWDAVSSFFYQWIPGFTQQRFEAFSALYQTYGFWVIMAKGLTPIPFKIITISAGACHVPLHIVVIASIISRGARFFVAAGLIRAFGEKARPYLEKHIERVFLVVLVLGILGFVALKYIH